MNVRAAAIAATAAFALAGLGAGPAFADNHISVAPQGQDGAFEHAAPRLGTFGDQGPKFLTEGDFEHLSPQHMADGAYEHLFPRTLVVGDLATN